MNSPSHTAVSCPDDEIDLLADDAIGPNEVGLFYCRVNGDNLRWTVNGVILNFPRVALDRTFDDDSISLPGSVAVLLTRDPSGTGNRTSVLSYAPDPTSTDAVTISCGGTSLGSALQPCSTIVDLAAIGGECIGVHNVVTLQHESLTLFLGHAQICIVSHLM